MGLSVLMGGKIPNLGYVTKSIDPIMIKEAITKLQDNGN